MSRNHEYPGASAAVLLWAGNKAHASSKFSTDMRLSWGHSGSNESFLVKWPSNLLTSGQRAQVRIRVHGQVPHRNGSYIRAKVPLDSKAQVVLPAAGKLFEVGSGVYFYLLLFFFLLMLSTSLAGLSVNSSSLEDICMKRQGDVSNKQSLING